MGNWRNFLAPKRITGGFCGLEFPVVERTLFDRRRWAFVRVTFLKASDERFQERLRFSVDDFARGVNRERFRLPFLDWNRDSLSPSDALKAMCREPMVYRVMVRPFDDVMNVQFVRTLMERCGVACDRRLVWVAAIHDKATVMNDGSRHCHVMVAGNDADGKGVRFARSFKADGFRFIAETLATEIMGPMTDHEVVGHRERHLRRHENRMPSRWVPTPRERER